MEIADRRVATVHFTLFDEQGAQITTTRGHDPLTYMQGAGGIVRGLEDALAGKSPGDRIEVSISPDDAFGKRHDALVQTLPRSLLGDAAEPKPGDRLKAQTEKGPMDVVVTGVEVDTVTVDGNHPLAGRPFRAEAEVIDVRVPTPQELQFGLG